MNRILLAGALLGLLSVLMAAYIDHSLAFTLTEKTHQSILTASKYHQLYALVITFLGLIIPLQAGSQVKRWLRISSYIFIAGILLFSFSIYLSSITSISALLYFTPVGGIVLMLGWISLLYTAFQKTK